MNFKFTKGKIIGIIVIPLIIWVLIFIIGSTILTKVPTIIRSFLEIHDRANIFSGGNISLFVIEIIIVYIIWSLFQRRK